MSGIASGNYWLWEPMAKFDKFDFFTLEACQFLVWKLRIVPAIVNTRNSVKTMTLICCLDFQIVSKSKSVKNLKENHSYIRNCTASSGQNRQLSEAIPGIARCVAPRAPSFTHSTWSKAQIRLKCKKG